jgi:hypothetical protein
VYFAVDVVVDGKQEKFVGSAPNLGKPIKTGVRIEPKNLFLDHGSYIEAAIETE